MEGESNNLHWKNKAVAITAHDIFDLAKSINELNMENFVIASQIFQTEGGYDCICHIKVPPSLPLALKTADQIKEPFVKTLINNKDKPTEKQLLFLKKNRFKIEPNLTKSQATEKIREYLERRNNENPTKSDKFVDY